MSYSKIWSVVMAEHIYHCYRDDEDFELDMTVITPLTDDLMLVRGDIWFSVDEKFNTQIRVVRNGTSSSSEDPTGVCYNYCIYC